MNNKKEMLDPGERVAVIIAMVIFLLLILSMTLGAAVFDAHRDGNQNETTTEEETK